MSGFNGTGIDMMAHFDEFIAIPKKQDVRTHIDDAPKREFYRLRTMRYPVADLRRIAKFVGWRSP